MSNTPNGEHSEATHDDKTYADFKSLPILDLELSTKTNGRNSKIWGKS